MESGGQKESLQLRDGDSQRILQVVNDLSDQQDQQRMFKAAFVLQGMAAGNPASRMLLVEAGAAQILVNILENVQNSSVLHQAAAKALEYLAQEPSLQHLLGQCALSPLLCLLKQNGIPLALLLQATDALKATMHNNTENTLLFVNSGGVETTIQLLTANSGPMSDGTVVISLLSLFGCLFEPIMASYGIEAVAATGISSTLVLLLKHNSSDVRQAALEIIYNCAAYGSLSDSKTDALGSLVAAGGIPALLKVAKSSISGEPLPLVTLPFLVVGTAMILIAIMGHLPCQQVSEFLGTDSLICITRMLSMVTAHTAVSPTFVPLLKFVSFILHRDDGSGLQQVARDMIAAGAVPLLVSAQLQAEISSSLPTARDIICRLADLSEATAVDALLPIYLAGIEEEQEIVLVVLAHIAKQSANFFKGFLEAVSTSWIGSMLTAMSCPDTDGRQLESAVNILSMAAATSPYIIRAIKDAGAQEVLQKLVADNASTSCNSLPTESMPAPGLSASNLKGDIMQLLRLLQSDLELNVDTGEVPGSLPVPQACQDHRELFASQIQAPARLGASQNAFATAPFSHLATVSPPLSNPQSANHRENPASVVGNATQISTDSLWKRMPGLPSGWHSITSSKASEYDDSAPTAVNGVAASLTTSKLGSALPGGLTAAASAASATVAELQACTSRLGKTSTEQQRHPQQQQQQQQQQLQPPPQQQQQQQQQQPQQPPPPRRSGHSAAVQGPPLARAGQNSYFATSKVAQRVVQVARSHGLAINRLMLANTVSTVLEAADTTPGQVHASQLCKEDTSRRGTELDAPGVMRAQADDAGEASTSRRSESGPEHLGALLAMFPAQAWELGEAKPDSADPATVIGTYESQD